MRLLATVSIMAKSLFHRAGEMNFALQYQWTLQCNIWQPSSSRRNKKMKPVNQGKDNYTNIVEFGLRQSCNPFMYKAR